MGRPFFYCVWYTMSTRIFNRLSKIYYSPQGYWKGFAAIKKLAQAAKVSEDVARNWLMKQALWQVYLPAPRYIPRPTFDVPVPNKVDQADLLYLPHDRPPRSRKTFKYALTVVDVAFRYKEAEPLTTKEAKEVAAALERIYSRGPLKWPKLLQVDPGCEFMGAVNQHNVEVRRGRVDIHRDQAIVERFNRTLAERLFGHQDAVEMRLPEGQRSTAWVKQLPEVVTALNNEVTSLTGKKPAVAIKEKMFLQSHRHLIRGRLGKEKKSSPLSLMCAISTNLASLKVV